MTEIDNATSTEYESLAIGGKWVKPATDRVIVAKSATTGERLGSVPEATAADVDHAVRAARAAFDAEDGWRTWAPEQRGEAMLRLADELDARTDETAARVSSQNGVVIQTTRPYEGQWPGILLRYYADLIAQQPAEEQRGTTVVRRVPVGVIGAIPPFNSPQVLAFIKIAPALAAGCTLVVKPSPETVLDSFTLAEAIIESEFPEGVISIVPGGREAGQHLVSHPGIDKVSFTGSTAAGREIASTCGQMLRPVTLELGGKSAAIILDDTELPNHSDAMFYASFICNGQACFASTRILAPDSRYDEVVDFYTSLAGAARIGDPLDPATQIGPMVNERQRDRVESYIAKGLSEGARLTTGGGRPAGWDAGWFVEPTIFADVDNSSTIAQEEIFGPVLAIVRYRDEDDAVRLANASPYGLGGTVWSEDYDRARAIARRVRTGTIGLNDYANDVNAPRGGMKDSGLGQELGPEGLADFQQLQSIYRP